MTKIEDVLECIQLKDNIDYCGFDDILTINDIECCKWKYLIINDKHYNGCRIQLTQSDVDRFYYNHIQSNQVLFIIGWVLQIFTFIMVLYYTIMVIKYLFCYDKASIKISRISKWMKLVTPIILMLCLASIGADFYHLIAPYLSETRSIYECGIRDANFQATRIVADATQFWAYLLFWIMMIYRLVFVFNGTPFQIKKYTLTILIFLIISVTLFLFTYNLIQGLHLENMRGADTILFTGYTISSILLNCIVMILFSTKLNQLISKNLSSSQQNWIAKSSNQIRKISTFSSENDSINDRSIKNNIDKRSLKMVLKVKKMEPQQRELVHLNTKYTALYSVQLISYMIRYFYRVTLSYLPEKTEKIQLLWIISYAGRDVMIVCMVFALYYGFSFVDDKYKILCGKCHRCCLKFSSFWIKKKLENILVSEIKTNIELSKKVSSITDLTSVTSQPHMTPTGTSTHESSKESTLMTPTINIK